METLSEVNMIGYYPEEDRDCPHIGVCDCELEQYRDLNLRESEIPVKIVKYINGKRMVKKTCGDGYRYDPELKRCVKLTPEELRKQKLANKKRVKKMKTKMNMIMRKRAKSMKIRDARGE